MLITDHTAHLELVKALGGRFGVPIPTTPSPLQLWEASVLATFSGAAFDQQWIAWQIAAHQVNIEKTQDEIADGCNRKVRALAKMTLPTLQAHLAAAQQLAAATPAPATPAPTTGRGPTPSQPGDRPGHGTDHPGSAIRQTAPITATMTMAPPTTTMAPTRTRATTITTATVANAATTTPLVAQGLTHRSPRYPHVVRRLAGAPRPDVSRAQPPRPRPTASRPPLRPSRPAAAPPAAARGE